MKQMLQKGLALILALALCLPAYAAADQRVQKAVEEAGAYVCQMVPAPQVGSTGGEWAVLGLARSGYEVPESYYQDYYAIVEKTVKDGGGVLHEKKYTEYSRVVMALSAIGRDARDVAGYDLTKPLGDYDKTIWQGLNGPIWALLALDSRDYPMPVNKEAKTQATRQMYIDCILSRQLPDGGWSLLGGTASAPADSTSDPDITGMALQALAKYQDQPAVAAATQEGLACLSGQQDKAGDFSSFDAANVESCAQAIVALCELGISLEDERFVKDGHTLLDALLSYRVPGKGFRHLKNGSGNDQMASEQGLYALAALWRAGSGKNSLYRMDDVAAAEGAPAGSGLKDKHADVRPVPVTKPGTTFSDTQDHPARTAIEALAVRGIINGKGGGRFCPDESVTRAEFAAIVVRALGLPTAVRGIFTDVSAGAWYAPFVDTAAAYGIIKGTGGGRFSPDGTMTRQEAAVMVARAAKLCGMDTELDPAAVRDVLAQFTDYIKAPEWARSGLAFCYREKILDDSALEIGGTAVIQRWEIAQMLCRLLEQAALL